MSESLAFKYFPWQYRRPSGVNAEFDPSQANTATQNARALLIGQITSSGTPTPNIAVQAYSQTQVNGLCGLNSMLALKYAACRLMDPFGEVWLGPLTDASGGTAAIGSISFTGPATAAGTLPLYLMGVSIPVAVNSGDNASTIATNTVAAIAASVGVACTAAIDGTNAYQVDLTALHKGLALNDIDIKFAYLGTLDPHPTLSRYRGRGFWSRPPVMGCGTPVVPGKLSGRPAATRAARKPKHCASSASPSQPTASTGSTGTRQRRAQRRHDRRIVPAAAADQPAQRAAPAAAPRPPRRR